MLKHKDNTRFRDYCHNRTVDMNTPARIVSGRYERLVSGNWISQKEFLQLYPQTIRPLAFSIQNPDKSKASLA